MQSYLTFSSNYFVLSHFGAKVPNLTVLVKNGILRKRDICHGNVGFSFLLDLPLIALFLPLFHDFLLLSSHFSFILSFFCSLNSFLSFFFLPSFFLFTFLSFFLFFFLSWKFFLGNSFLEILSGKFFLGNYFFLSFFYVMSVLYTPLKK